MKDVIDEDEFRNWLITEILAIQKKTFNTKDELENRSTKDLEKIYEFETMWRN